MPILKFAFPSISFLIILIQHFLQVRHLIEYLSCELRIGNNPPVPIVLQGTRADIQPFAYFLACQEMLTAKQRFVCLCHFLYPSVHSFKCGQHHLHIIRFQVQVSYLFHHSLSLFVILRFVYFRFIRFGLEQLFHILTLVIALMPDLGKWQHVCIPIMLQGALADVE